MLVLREQLGEAYRDIRLASSSASPVLLFVTAECDSVCACHILTSLMRMDHILYKVVPVASYDDLAKGEAALDDSVRSIVLINCGSMIDLQGFFHTDDEQRKGLHIFVLDAHRPYNLANVRSDNHCVVCLDSSIEAQSYPSDDDLSSSDDDDDDDRARSPARRRERKQREQKVADYYSGSFYSISVAALAYDLAQQISKDDNELLWSGIVGLTDQWVHQRISRWAYQAEVDLFMKQVFDKNVPDAFDDDGGVVAIAPDEDQVRMQTDATITFETKELGFFLFRHWNLFESMFHSRRLATKLKVWRDTGKQQLNLILAKLGIPLEESKSPYRFMQSMCKKRLCEELGKYAPEYGLDVDDLFLASFTRRYGNDLVVSASDVVHAVSGLLEASHNDVGPTTWEQNFWAAHDSMKSSNVHLTRRGLSMAIELQEQIALKGHSLLLRKTITSTGTYRLCIFERPGQHSQFTQPLALSKLAFFLIDAYETTLLEQAAIQKRKRGRPGSNTNRTSPVKIVPFVLCSYIEERNSYLVIGIPRARSGGEVQRNAFSVGFAEAAILTKARIKQDGFEASVVEVTKDNLKRFLEALVAQLL